MLDRAGAELVDTERMVEAAERLYGPYRWGRYDVIVLPPSFPYGGMENPTLTFLTPTFIAGDRSLVGLVAHELAHSWSGNLVTNAVWPDSWLNEGVTSYFENRIMEALYGRAARGAGGGALPGTTCRRRLRRARRRPRRAPGSTTRPTDDPDGGSSGIVYDKGALFLRTIERIVGRARLDAYLRSYFDRHAFQPMTSARFLADLRANLIRGDAALEQRLKLDRLGLSSRACRTMPRGPTRAPSPRSMRAVRRSTPAGRARACRYAGWTAAERLRFLNALPRQLSAARLAELDRRFGLRQSGNKEVLFAWLSSPSPTATSRRCRRPSASCSAWAGASSRAALPGAVGEGDWGRPIAQRIYARARPAYHPVTTGPIDRIMRGQPAARRSVTARTRRMSPGFRTTTGWKGRFPAASCRANPLRTQGFHGDLPPFRSSILARNLTFHQSLAARAKVHQRDLPFFDVSRACSH